MYVSSKASPGQVEASLLVSHGERQHSRVGRTSEGICIESAKSVVINRFLMMRVIRQETNEREITLHSPRQRPTKGGNQ